MVGNATTDQEELGGFSEEQKTGETTHVHAQGISLGIIVKQVINR